jgi:hypothetical protein
MGRVSSETRAKLIATTENLIEKIILPTFNGVENILVNNLLQMHVIDFSGR